MIISGSSPTWWIGSVVTITVLGFAHEIICNIQPNSTSSLVHPRILYAQSDGISWSDLGLQERLPPLLKDTNTDIISIDYHYKNNYIVYSTSNSIWRLMIDPSGGEHEPIEFLSNLDAPKVAVDWVRDRLYWVRSEGGHLLVQWTHLSGPLETPEEIMNLGMDLRPNYSNVVLDPYSRVLFFIIDDTTLMKVNIDGEGLWRVVLGLAVDERVNTLALDIHRERLYMSSVQDYVPRLWSCEYDGSIIQEYDLSSKWWNIFISIDIFNDQLFWVHHRFLEKDTVWKANISTNGSLTWEEEYKPPGSVDSVGSIRALKVYHPDIQTPWKNLSENTTRGILNVTSRRPHQPVLSSSVTISSNVIFAIMFTVFTSTIL